MNPWISSIPIFPLNDPVFSFWVYTLPQMKPLSSQYKENLSSGSLQKKQSLAQ